MNRVLMALSAPRCWRWLLTLWLLGACSTSGAVQLLREQGLWVDSTAQAGIDQAQAQTYEVFSGVLLRGYTRDAVWLRLVLAPSADAHAVQLRVRPTFLDDVRLYWRDPSGQWIEARDGDAHALQPQQRVGPSLGFALPASQQTRVVYLRVASSSSMMVSVQATSRGDAVRAEVRMVWWQLVYAGFMLWLLFWAIQESRVTHDSLSMAFAVYQSANLVYAVLVLGYGPWLSPAAWGSWANLATSWSVVLSIVTGLVFHRSVFVAFGAAPWLRALLWLPLVLGLLIALNFALGAQQASLAANSWLVLAAGPVLFGITWLLDAHANRLVPTLRAVYGLQLASTLLSMVPLLGLASVVEWSLYAGLLHGFIAAVSMYFILSRRSRQQLRVAQQLHEQSALMTQELRLQREHNVQQSRLVDMLTHELKTPVAVAMISLDAIADPPSAPTARIRRALNNINRIVERARWSEMVSQRRLQPQWQAVSVSEVVLEAVDATLTPNRIELHLGQERVIQCDRQLLALVLANLLDNALKYSPPGSSVDVWVLERESLRQLAIGVGNSVGSAGVPDARQVFTKYYRQPEVSGISGSGLGLYLVKQLMDLLRGELRWSADAQRVEFECRFPL